MQVCPMPAAASMVSSGISNVLLAADTLAQPINRNKPAVSLGRSRTAGRLVWSLLPWSGPELSPLGDRQMAFALAYHYAEPAALSFRLGQSRGG